MQQITARLVKVVDEETRTDNPKKYKILQVVVGENGLTPKISGEILSVIPANMDGHDCQAIRIMGNGGKYMKTYRLVDYDMGRKYQPGKQVSVYAKPHVKIKDGSPVIVFVAESDQENPSVEPVGELYLLAIKDYDCKTEWKPGKITFPVSLTPWASNNKKGINYKVEAA